MTRSRWYLEKYLLQLRYGYKIPSKNIMLHNVVLSTRYALNRQVIGGFGALTQNALPLSIFVICHFGILHGFKMLNKHCWYGTWVNLDSTDVWTIDVLYGSHNLHHDTSQKLNNQLKEGVSRPPRNVCRPGIFSKRFERADIKYIIYM